MAGEASCLFCRIVSGKAPSKGVEIADPELAKLVHAFEDIAPRAPLHVLVVPREHIATVNDLKADHASLVGKMVLAARSIAQARGVASSGYRLVLNTNPGAGQTVYHIHLHLLGGRPLGWPPG